MEDTTNFKQVNLPELGTTSERIDTYHDPSSPSLKGYSTSLKEINSPEIGMTFSSEAQVRDFYQSYSKNIGFGISKLNTKNGEDGKPRYFSFGCAKSRKIVCKSTNILHPRPSTKTDCKAKINVVVHGDKKFVITGVHLEHNHLLSPRKSRHFRSNKVLDLDTKRRLELNDEAGIPLSKSFQSFVVEAGGYDNLSFDERSCRNYISETRKLRLGDGDAEALSAYFCQMQSRNSNFFYALDLDGESRIRNVFWADARSRAAYAYFSDAITFDTTYLTNSYDMPFAPFVGVNHHGQSILFGCGLLSSEDTEAFIWLFKTLLICMFGRAPKAIVTDQCRSMEIAIAEVFPNSHHRLCLWHIMKKIPAKLSGFAQYKMIKKQMKTIVYNSLTVDECDKNWQSMIQEFNLENNIWLKSLNEERNKWMPVYVKDKFWAGMSTSQRSESMNAFFDDYVHSKTSLKQFVEQYDNALKRKIENEKVLDFASFNSVIPLITDYPIEKQFQDVYTNKIFKVFQNELRGLMFCNASLLKEEGTTMIFEVVETILATNKELLRKACFVVHYTMLDCQVSCLCRMFEFRGILCRHVISVLIMNGMVKIPENYIIDRWRKNVKRGYQSITSSYDNHSSTEERHRHQTLTPLINEVQQLGEQSDEGCSLLVEVLKDVKDKLITINFEHSMTENNYNLPLILQNDEKLKEVSTSGTKTIHSPIKVRARGRPPNKRKQSVVENIVRRSMRKSARKSADSEKKV